MRELKDGLFSDIIKLGNGKVKPNNIGSIPIYGGNGILGYGDDFNYSGETVIIGRVGAYCGSVYHSKEPIWVSDNALSAKPKNDECTKYIYYLLQNLKLNSYAEGSSHPLVTQGLLNSIEIHYHQNNQEQQAIAEVLSSLDDKIDLLHRNNKTLEDMADALFSENYKSSANELKLKLKDIVTTSGGYNHKLEELSEDGDILLSMGSITKEYGLKLDSCRYINNARIDPKLIANAGDIIITTRDITQDADLLGSPGVISKRLNKRIIVGSNLYKIQVITRQIDPIWLYFLLRSKNYREYVKEVASGTSILMLKKEDLLNFEFYPPSGNEAGLLPLLNSLCHKLEANIEQIQYCTKMRATLLPKLMSGQVRVNINA
jgi:type I restriction enzyme S subunit